MHITYMVECNKYVTLMLFQKTGRKFWNITGGLQISRMNLVIKFLMKKKILVLDKMALIQLRKQHGKVARRVEVTVIYSSLVGLLPSLVGPRKFQKILWVLPLPTVLVDLPSFMENLVVVTAIILVEWSKIRWKSRFLIVLHLLKKTLPQHPQHLLQHLKNHLQVVVKVVVIEKRIVLWLKSIEAIVFNG